MKKRLQWKMSMYLMVRKQLLEEREAMESLPGFTQNEAEFESYFQQILMFNARQNFKGTGAAVEKEVLKKQLIRDTAVVTSKMLAYARYNNLMALIPDVDYCESRLKRMSATKLIGVAGSIQIRATENLANMSGFLLTEAEVEQLTASIQAYQDAMSSPRMQRMVRKFRNRDLEGCFDAADELLGKIDIVAELIRYTHPAVYERYKTARKLEMVGVSYLSLKGTIKDAATTLPVTSALITFVEVDEDGVAVDGEEPVLTKSTADKGGFFVKSLAEGSYRVTVTKVGYKEKVLNIVVNANEMHDLSLALEAA